MQKQPVFNPKDINVSFKLSADEHMKYRVLLLKRKLSWRHLMRELLKQWAEKP